MDTAISESTRMLPRSHVCANLICVMPYDVRSDTYDDRSLELSQVE